MGSFSAPCSILPPGFIICPTYVFHIYWTDNYERVWDLVRRDRIQGLLALIKSLQRINWSSLLWNEMRKKHATYIKKWPNKDMTSLLKTLLYLVVKKKKWLLWLRQIRYWDFLLLWGSAVVRPLGIWRCLRWRRRRWLRWASCWAGWCCRAAACAGTGWWGCAAPGSCSPPRRGRSPADSPPPARGFRGSDDHDPHVQQPLFSAATKSSLIFRLF